MIIYWQIYVVGEDKLITITFFKSVEELRQIQDSVVQDLTNRTGLTFIADDRLPFKDRNGIIDPSK